MLALTLTLHLPHLTCVPLVTFYLLVTATRYDAAASFRVFQNSRRLVQRECHWSIFRSDPALAVRNLSNASIRTAFGVKFEFAFLKLMSQSARRGTKAERERNDGVLHSRCTPFNTWKMELMERISF